MRFLRRANRVIKQQNWFAYVVELGIVITGVYIAYQLTVWNEKGKTYAASLVMLQNLYSENSINLRELGNLNTYRKEIVASTNHLLYVLNKNTPVSEDSLTEAVLAIQRMSTPIIVTNVLDEYLRNNSSTYPKLNIELYKLRGYYNDLQSISTIHWDKKEQSYYNYLNSSIDFTKQEVSDFRNIRSLSFKNNIYYLLDSEREFTRLHNQAYMQVLKVKQMIDALK